VGDLGLPPTFPALSSRLLGAQLVLTLLSPLLQNWVAVTTAALTAINALTYSSVDQRIQVFVCATLCVYNAWACVRASL
jgi:hypothetical protein